MLQMRDYAREATALLAGRTRADLDTDRLLNLAIVRVLEVLGEAARRVPEGVRAEHPHIEWPRIVGLRNRLIHEYDVVDFDTVMQVVRDDLPPLIAELDEILGAQGGR
jgi:uncharacterized protein with HEPN domain